MISGETTIAQYIVRVEPVGLDGEDTRALYKRLHQVMAAEGYALTITGEDDVKHHLPDATYYHHRKVPNSALEVWGEVNSLLLRNNLPAVILVSKSEEIAFTERPVRNQAKGLFALLDIKPS